MLSSSGILSQTLAKANPSAASAAFSGLSNGVEDGLRGQDLRQDHGRAFFASAARSRVNQIHRHAGPAIRLKYPGDSRVLSGPVGSQCRDTGLCESPAHLRIAQRNTFVDLASDAPCGCEVDEDRFALGAELIQQRLTERLPTQAALLGGLG